MFDLTYGQSILSNGGIDGRKKKKEKARDNGREGRCIYIDLTYQAHFTFTTLEIMAKFIYIYLLVVLFFNLNDATRPIDPLQGIFKKIYRILLSYYNLYYI